MAQSLKKERAVQKFFIIFSQLREGNRNSESKCPLASPQKAAKKAIELESPCSKCRGITGKLGAGGKPGRASISCSECKKFVRWISAAELSVLGKGGEA